MITNGEIKKLKYGHPFVFDNNIWNLEITPLNLCMFSILFNFIHGFLCCVQNDPSIQLLPPKKKKEKRKKKRVDCCFFQLRPQNKCNFF